MSRSCASALVAFVIVAFVIVALGCGHSLGVASDAGPDPCACPATPPTSGALCDRTKCGASLACVYDDCAGRGETNATCATTTWQVATAACAAKPCPDGNAMTCAPGEICRISQAGALIPSCVPNPCDGGPVGSACGCSVCGDGTCQSVVGSTVTCSECFEAQCP